MPILPREVGVVSYYYAACRHCVIDIGPLIKSLSSLASQLLEPLSC